MGIVDDFKKRREEGNARVLSEDFLNIKRFFALDTQAFQDGAVPAKYKEMTGLAVSMAMRCNDCIVYHIDKCVEKGCTDEELNEIFNIALMIGGSVVIPYVRYAYKALDELRGR